MMPVAGTFGLDASASVNSRPWSGLTPSVEKKLRVTTMPPSDWLPSGRIRKLKVQR